MAKAYRKPLELTDAAINGFHGNENPHIATSPNWYAHKLGAYLHATGRPVPSNVRMGRGDSIRCRDMRFTFKQTEGNSLQFERVE